jgi:hypothetical protein
MNKLLVAVMGNRNSGKSSTWNTLFGSEVRTGTSERKLFLNECEYVNVFLIGGSPEEREKYVGDIISENRPKIVLCSAQYKEDVKTTFNYFTENDYFLFVHWLNPGYKDPKVQYYDHLGLANWLLAKPSVIGLRSGHEPIQERVDEIKAYIYGWAKQRNLIINNCQ